LECPKSFDRIDRLVQARQDVITLRMSSLRDAYGAGRLGKMVRENISKELESRGLGHYPIDLPDYQEDKVRIYRLGSPTADLIRAFLEKPQEKNDELIRDAVSHEAKKTLAKIKELFN